MQNGHVLNHRFTSVILCLANSSALDTGSPSRSAVSKEISAPSDSVPLTFTEANSMISYTNHTI